ncbi:MarR family transcriptional regulator [Actinomadura sp. 7K507]|nr:MarR family transcriptional regulator [Actinomadura sp. 7K507]
MVDVDPGVEAARQRIGRLARMFTRSLEQVASEEGLSVADWEALSVIVRAGGRCTPTALARALRLTSGTVSTRLNRLLQAGLITLGTTDTDGRSRPVSVTDEGFARWQRATARRTRSERQIFDELTVDEIDSLNDLLRPLLHRYEAALGTAARHDLTGQPRPES